MHRPFFETAGEMATLGKADQPQCSQEAHGAMAFRETSKHSRRGLQTVNPPSRHMMTATVFVMGTCQRTTTSNMHPVQARKKGSKHKLSPEIIVRIC